MGIGSILKSKHDDNPMDSLKFGKNVNEGSQNEANEEDIADGTPEFNNEEDLNDNIETTFDDNVSTTDVSSINNSQHTSSQNEDLSASEDIKTNENESFDSSKKVTFGKSTNTKSSPKAKNTSKKYYGTESGLGAAASEKAGDVKDTSKKYYGAESGLGAAASEKASESINKASSIKNETSNVEDNSSDVNQEESFVNENVASEEPKVGVASENTTKKNKTESNKSDIEVNNDDNEVKKGTIIEDYEIESDDSKNSSIKSIFFDNDRLEPKDHGPIATAIIGESKLNLSHKDEIIETVGGEVNDEEVPKLTRPTPKEEDIIETNAVDDSFENVKFASDVHLDDDIKNKASEVVSNAFDDILSEVNNDNNDSLNDEELEYINDFEEGYQYPSTEEENQEDETDTYVGSDDYYQSARDITNPLRKNNIAHDFDNKNKSVKESLVNEVKYINKSLKEIENSSPAEYVSVIDRTKEYGPEENITPQYDDSEYIFNEEKDNEEVEHNQDEFEITFGKDDNPQYDEKVMTALKREIESDENVIIPIHKEKETSSKIKDDDLEDIIQTADVNYRKIEKERFQKNNVLKDFEDKPPKKQTLKDEIVDYQEAQDIGLYSQEDLYDKSEEDVANSINNIVKIEGPVHVSEVVKRVKNSCNIKRAGANLKKRVNQGIDVAEGSGTIIKIGDFLYDAENNDVNIRKRHKPNIELISNEEIVKNIERILTYKENVSTKSLPKEVSRNFGFKSTSKKTAKKINNVLDLMIAENKVIIDDDTLKLK